MMCWAFLPGNGRGGPLVLEEIPNLVLVDRTLLTLSSPV